MVVSIAVVDAATCSIDMMKQLQMRSSWHIW